MQFSSGVLTAYIYAVFIRMPTFQLDYQYALLGLALGFVHGIAVSVVLAKLLAEHHPVKDFQHVDTGVAVIHVFAHMVYGLALGVLYAIFM